MRIVPITESLASRKPVLLQHGLGTNGLVWMLRSDEDLASTPVAMMEAGYDVWLGNFRGSVYSLEHENLSSESDTAYWDFSWAEIGLYDLPAMVGYIYEKANERDVTYIGSSQATTAMFYGLAHNDAGILADKLTEVLALAPCFLFDHESPLNPIDNYVDYTLVDTAMEELGIDHINRKENGISKKTLIHFEQNAFTDRF